MNQTEQAILRIVIYARLSKNRHGLSTNTAIQIAECESEAAYYAKDRGLKLVIVERFPEDDKSASKYSDKPRPLYDLMLNLIRANKVDMVWCTETERLVRRPRQMDELIDLAETTSLRELYFTSDEGFDLSSPNGIYRARQAVNAAERESRKISQRVKRKLTANAKEGKSNGGRRCFGYKRGNMELEPSEVPIVRDMAQKIISGWSYSELAWYLNENQIKTSWGNEWYPVSVHNLLTRQRFVGIRIHQGNEYPAQWPAIFAPEEWSELQLEIRTRGEKYSNLPKRRKNLLTGLLTCGKCGRSLTGEVKYDHPGDAPRRTYTCRKPADKSRIDKGCAGVTVNAPALEEYIRQLLIAHLDDENLARLLNTDGGDASELKSLLVERTQKLAQRKVLEDERADGLLDKDEFYRMRGRVNDAIAKLDEQVAETRQRHTRLPITAGQSIADAWDENPDGFRRILIDRVFKRIEIKQSRAKPKFILRDGTVARFHQERVVVEYRELDLSSIAALINQGLTSRPDLCRSVHKRRVIHHTQAELVVPSHTHEQIPLHPKLLATRNVQLAI